MSFQVAYNPSLENALVGVSYAFHEVPEGIITEWHEGDLPDFTKVQWSPGGLNFINTNTQSRFLSTTAFMRRFTFTERLAVRSLEREGDLVVIDAMSLMQGTEDGVNLDDPDVLLTLQYLFSKGIIEYKRIQEILL
jgi:hypothetical protein